MRKVLAFVAATALLAAIFGAPAITTFADQGPPECSPGQHGNPHPGFKPGSCK